MQIQAGGSYVDVELPGVAAVVQGLGGATRFVGGAPHAQLFVPTIRVGLIVALF